MDDKAKMLEITRETSNHAYLATCDATQPIIRSVSPIVEENMSIWVTTFSNSRKVKQIKSNPKICLYFASQPDGERTAKIIGTAAIINDLTVKKRIWNLAGFDLSKYFPEGPESSDFSLLKIDVKRIEWWDNFEEGTKVYEVAK